MKSNAIRVVVDTNVFISAVLFKGEPAKLLDLWKNTRLKFLICKEVLEEYIKVLSYPKFKLSEEEIKYILEEDLLLFVDPVNITSEVDIIKEDNADNKFIALAIDGNANFIISGDSHLLKLKKFQGIGIVSIKEFLSRF